MSVSSVRQIQHQSWLISKNAIWCYTVFFPRLFSCRYVKMQRSCREDVAQNQESNDANGLLLSQTLWCQAFLGSMYILAHLWFTDSADCNNRRTAGEGKTANIWENKGRPTNLAGKKLIVVTVPLPLNVKYYFLSHEAESPFPHANYFGLLAEENETFQDLIS